MATSGIEEVAMRLLEAFYDLSGHDPTRPVPVGAPGSPPQESAAATAGIEPGSTECAVAVRYLLNQGYVEKTDVPGAYTISVPGIDRVREMRGLTDSASSKGGNRMSDQTQRRLLTVLAIAIAMVLTRPVTRFIEQEIPERRGIRDDLTEAALQGLVRAAAFFAASILRRLRGGSGILVGQAILSYPGNPPSRFERKDADDRACDEPEVQPRRGVARLEEPRDAPRGSALPYHPGRDALPPDPLRHTPDRPGGIRTCDRGSRPQTLEAHPRRDKGAPGSQRARRDGVRRQRARPPLPAPDLGAVARGGSRVRRVDRHTLAAHPRRGRRAGRRGRSPLLRPRPGHRRG